MTDGSQSTRSSYSAPSGSQSTRPATGYTGRSGEVSSRPQVEITPHGTSQPGVITTGTTPQAKPAPTPAPTPSPQPGQPGYHAVGGDMGIIGRNIADVKQNIAQTSRNLAFRDQPNPFAPQHTVTDTSITIAPKVQGSIRPRTYSIDEITGRKSSGIDVTNVRNVGELRNIPSDMAQYGSPAYNKALQRAEQDIKAAGSYRTLGAQLSDIRLFEKSIEVGARRTAASLGIERTPSTDKAFSQIEKQLPNLPDSAKVSLGFLKTTVNTDLSNAERDLKIQTANALNAVPFTGKYDVGKTTIRYPKSLGEASFIGKVAIESPATAAIPIAAEIKIGSFLLRSALIEGAARLAPSVPRIARGLNIAQASIEPAITAAGLGYVGYNVGTSKDVYEAFGRTVGLIAQAPLAMKAYEFTGRGLITGQTALTYPRGFIGQVYRGEGFKPPINPDVLSGKLTFPTSRAGTFEKYKAEFEKTKGEYAGFHATPESFGKGITVRAMEPAQLRRSDVPGLYASAVKKGASPYFLRLKGGEYGDILNVKSFMQSSPLKPEINLISQIKDIERIPGGKNVQKSREFLYKQVIEANRQGSGLVRKTSTSPSRAGQRGIAYIEPKIEMGGFRGESQVIIPPGTQIGGIKSTRLVNVYGHLVPYVQRDIVGLTELKPSAAITKGIKPLQYGEYVPEYPLRAVPISSKVYPSSRVIPSSKTVIPSRVIPSSKVITSRTMQSSVITPSSRVIPSSTYIPTSRTIPTSRMVSSSIITPSSVVVPSSAIIPSKITIPTSRIFKEYYPNILGETKKRRKAPAFRGYLKTYRLGGAENIFAQVERYRKQMKKAKR